MKSAVADLKKEGFVTVMIDCRKQAGLAYKHGVRSVPSFIFAKDGKKVDLHVGKLSAGEMRAFFE